MQVHSAHGIFSVTITVFEVHAEVEEVDLGASV